MPRWGRRSRWSGRRPRSCPSPSEPVSGPSRARRSSGAGRVRWALVGDGRGRTDPRTAWPPARCRSPWSTSGQYGMGWLPGWLERDLARKRMRRESGSLEPRDAYYEAFYTRLGSTRLGCSMSWRVVRQVTEHRLRTRYRRAGPTWTPRFGRWLQVEFGTSYWRERSRLDYGDPTFGSLKIMGLLAYGETTRSLSCRLSTRRRR